LCLWAILKQTSNIRSREKECKKKNNSSKKN
jgi:hypothetical protein